jgi:hypothetical protein
MSVITWKNVDAPDFTGALRGVGLTNTLLNQAVESAEGGIDLFQKMKKDAADRAVQGRINALSFDPAGMQQAMLNGTLAGPDEMSMSADMLARLPNQVDSAITGTKNFDTYTRQTDTQQKWDALRPDFQAAMKQAATTGDIQAFMDNPIIGTLPQAEQIKARESLLNASTTGLNNTQEWRTDQRTEEDLATKKLVTEAAARLIQIEDPFARKEATAKYLAENNFSDTVAAQISAAAGVPFGAPVAPPVGVIGDRYDPTNYANRAFNDFPVPEDIKTLGDYTNKANFPRLNRTKDGELSSPFGIYQMTAGTIEEVGESALGKNWREANLRDPLVQTKLAEALFNKNKAKGLGGEGLSKRWAALEKYYTPQQIEQISKAPWDEAKGYIWKAEHGISDVGNKAKAISLELNQTYSTELGRNPQAEGYLQLMTSGAKQDDVIRDLLAKGSVTVADEETSLGALRSVLTKAMNRGGDGETPLSPAMAGEFLRNSQKSSRWLTNDTETGADSSIDWGAFDANVKQERNGGLFNAAINLESIKKAQEDLATKSTQYEQLAANIGRLERGVANGTNRKEDLKLAKESLEGLGKEIGKLNAQVEATWKLGAKDITKVEKPTPSTTPPPSQAAAKIDQATKLPPKPKELPANATREQKLQLQLEQAAYRDAVEAARKAKTGGG